MTLVLSQSRIKAWRSCRRKYFYKYIMGIEPKRKSQPLLRGNLIHKMIEEKISGRDPNKVIADARKNPPKGFLEERVYYDETLDMVETLMGAYFEFYKKDSLTPIKVGKLKAEHHFEVELTPSISLQGKIDEIAHHRGLVMVVDHKSKRKIPKSGEVSYSDLQKSLYCWAAERAGLVKKVDGFIWNYIRAEAPVVPDLLKDGSLSRRSNMDTIWPVYHRAILDHKLDPKDYLNMKALLKGRESNFFYRRPETVNKALIHTLVEEAQVTGREIKRKAGHDKTRTIDRQCDWCDFYSICQAELRGLDSKVVLEREYQEKKDEEIEPQQSE